MTNWSLKSFDNHELLFMLVREAFKKSRNMGVPTGSDYVMLPLQKLMTSCWLFPKIWTLDVKNLALLQGSTIGKFAISWLVRQALLSLAPDWWGTKFWPIRSHAQPPYSSALHVAVRFAALRFFIVNCNASILLQKKAIGHVTWRNRVCWLLRQAQQSLPNWPKNYKLELQ